MGINVDGITPCAPLAAQLLNHPDKPIAR